MVDAPVVVDVVIVDVTVPVVTVVVEYVIVVVVVRDVDVLVAEVDGPRGDEDDVYCVEVLVAPEPVVTVKMVALDDASGKRAPTLSASVRATATATVAPTPICLLYSDI